MTTIDEGLEIALAVSRGEGPNMEREEEWVDAAVALVESDAFTLGQAAEILGVTKARLYRKVAQRVPKREGKRTSGGVAGAFKLADIDSIRYIRLRMEGRSTREEIDPRVRESVKNVLSGGTGATVLAHLTGMNVHTLRRVKAGGLW